MVRWSSTGRPTCSAASRAAPTARPSTGCMCARFIVFFSLNVWIAGLRPRGQHVDAATAAERGARCNGLCGVERAGLRYGTLRVRFQHTKHTQNKRKHKQGGQEVVNCSLNVPIKSVEVYYPSNNTWVFIAPISHDHFRFRGVSFNNRSRFFECAVSFVVCLMCCVVLQCVRGWRPGGRGDADALRQQLLADRQPGQHTTQHPHSSACVRL